ncbi:MAG: hypothetical protein IPL88_14760 [Rhizobiales bacterium]|nr:hypothetical protein [Hyphomicrobiales bacterium]
MRLARLFRLAAAAAALFAAAGAQAQTYDLANELAVDAANRSEGVLCAEKDNVYVPLSSRSVRAFRIQAVHPAYIGSVGVDRWAPDWTSCDMSNDPSFGAQARRVTFWETPEFWLTGYTFPSFWRPGAVPFRVGERVETGLHVVQLWMRHRERAEEILVVYPPDGYWRARPLPFADMRWTAYGSSFLVGPVEVQGRPIVALKEIAFDPETKSFKLSFERGGAATLKLTSVDQDRLVLDVTLDGPTPEGLPFAALRSMYATEFNSDVAKVAWREKNGAQWRESGVMDFPGAAVTELWAGRTLPSRHNTSAPDMVFSRFTSAP